MKILRFLDSFKLYGRLLVNQKTVGNTSRKLFPLKNDFKTCSAELVMPTDPTKRWNWDLKVCQIPFTKWTQTTSFGCALNKKKILGISTNR